MRLGDGRGASGHNNVAREPRTNPPGTVTVIVSVASNVFTSFCSCMALGGGGRVGTGSPARSATVSFGSAPPPFPSANARRRQALYLASTDLILRGLGGRNRSHSHGIPAWPTTRIGWRISACFLVHSMLRFTALVDGNSLPA